MRIKQLTLVISAGLLLAGCQSTPPALDADRSADSKDDKTAGKPQAPQSQRAATSQAAVPAGTVLHVRIDSTLSTARNQAGDAFTATLVEPVRVAGADLIPKGSRFKGHVTTSDSSGRLKGRAVIGVTLDSFELSGAEHTITTSLDSKTSDAHKKRNIEMIGGGAGVGALIGGLVGGGKGVAIGAATGAGAGTSGAYATGKKEVAIPAETVLRFTLKSSVAL